jgi:hypothetical protein
MRGFFPQPTLIPVKMPFQPYSLFLTFTLSLSLSLPFDRKKKNCIDGKKNMKNEKVFPSNPPWRELVLFLEREREKVRVREKEKYIYIYICDFMPIGSSAMMMKILQSLHSNH